MYSPVPDSRSDSYIPILNKFYCPFDFIRFHFYQNDLKRIKDPNKFYQPLLPLEPSPTTAWGLQLY